MEDYLSLSRFVFEHCNYCAYSGSDSPDQVIKCVKHAATNHILVCVFNGKNDPMNDSFELRHSECFILYMAYSKKFDEMWTKFKNQYFFGSETEHMLENLFPEKRNEWISEVILGKSMED